MNIYLSVMTLLFMAYQVFLNDDVIKFPKFVVDDGTGSGSEVAFLAEIFHRVLFACM